MKIRITNHNLLLKLASVLISVFLWLVVVNINHPVVSKTVTVRKVVYLNEDTIINSGRTYTVDSLDKGVSISVPVQKTDANKVKADDFEVVVDLASMGPFGAVQIDVRWLGSDSYKINESEISWKTTTVNVFLEDVIERNYTVQLFTQGDPAEGFVLGEEIGISHKKVSIKAPRSIMEQIHSVGIEVDVDGANAELTGETKLVFYDVTGEALNINRSDLADYEFAVSQENIGYRIPLLKVKEVGLRFAAPVGTPAEGYRFSGIQGANKRIQIAGLRAVLATIDVIEIPSEALNLEGADANVPLTLDLTDYVSPNITIEGESRISVILLVEPLVSRLYGLTLDQIQIEGAREGYSYRLEEIPEETETEESESGAETETESSTDSGEEVLKRTGLQVLIQGLEEDLNLLREEELDAYVDVTELSEGTHRTEVKIHLGEGYSLKETTTVQVIAEKK